MFLATIRRFIRKQLSGRAKNREIAPDEIFLDAHNFPQFNESQFEGRIERPIKKRTLRVFYALIIFVGIIFIGRIGALQIAEGARYAALSENNRLEHSILFADRGVFYDRNGLELAWNESDDTRPFAKRAYADIPGLAHVVGYVQYPLADAFGVYYQEEYVGKAGAELSLASLIRGVNGLSIIETDARGAETSKHTIRRPENGENVTLSIDARVSEAFYLFMEETAESVSFEGGTGVLMDVVTGEILALVSYPEYRSQKMTGGDADALATYRNDSRKPFLNRAVSGLYTPGSIVKPFLALGALEEEIITPEEKIESTGSIAVPNPYDPEKPTIFRDWKAHGWVDMEDALAVSSDVYFYEISGGYENQKGLGIANIETYMRFFGFGTQTGINLGVEEVGTIPNPQWKKNTFEDGVWRIGNTYHTAIGQYGFQITPIQAVRAVGALANDGVLLSPTLVLGDSVERQTIQIEREYFAVVKAGMRAAVTRGTAAGLSIPQVSVAAKTGTAELGVLKKYVNSWVIGFFPYEQPRYAFAVVMERGPSENLIGALFVMRRLLEWMSVHTPLYLE